MPAPPKEVDVIIVGGGTSGCVIAGRLSKADPTLEIAIIEAGINNLNEPAIIRPAMFLSHLAPTSATASFYVSEETEACAGRSCVVPSGALLGGGSSINFMMYTRASASDYDDWKTEGWYFKDLLPLALKMETCHLADGHKPELHGTSGPLNVSYGGHQSNIGKEFVAAARSSYDIPFTDDLQDFQTGHGLTNWAKWICPKTGRRSDTAHGYIHPITKERANLHVVTEQKTIRVLFEGETAVGVEYCQNPLATAPFNAEQPPSVGEISTMKARKMVVVSSGAFGSPMLLERSGIGAAEVLKAAGVDLTVDLPGVGAEYQDHQSTLATYCVAPEEDTLDDFFRGVPEVHANSNAKWTKDGSGMIASNGIDAGMKVRPNEKELVGMGSAFGKVWDAYFKDKPDKPVMVGSVLSSFLGDHSLLPPGRYMMLAGFLMYPFSRGFVHIKSSNPFDPPHFRAGFLDHEADMAPQVWMYKVLREIARRMPTYRGELAPAHPKFSAASEAHCRDFGVNTSKAVNGDKAVSAEVGTEETPAENAAVSPDRKVEAEAIEIKDLVYSEEDNEAIEQWVRENVQCLWHSSATNPMKPRDQGGVVDARLNVYGTKNLKVADLSIIPENVGSNTMSVALIIGEKAALLIGEDLGIDIDLGNK